MTSLEFHPGAALEFEEAVRYYSERNARIGREFVGAIGEAVSFVVSNPSACLPVRDKLRKWLVRRFPYYIVFRQDEGRLYILAIAHQRRRPEYWRDRA